MTSSDLRASACFEIHVADIGKLSENPVPSIMTLRISAPSSPDLDKRVTQAKAELRFAAFYCCGRCSGQHPHSPDPPELLQVPLNRLSGHLHTPGQIRWAAASSGIGWGLLTLRQTSVI